ncbi:MAG: hypothetical protein LBK97_00625 [Prevotellaceae bacterium]|jgi:hypothetical protein|nr:hypothetical protein [Prevotellaceae bacterium]
MHLKSNTDTKFVGIEKLKEKHKSQLDLFESWAASGNWADFHNSHYDWWMFPYDKSSAYGKSFTIYEAEVCELKNDAQFIQNYLRGVELLLLSWGWDLKRQCFVENPAEYQTWANWPIRLYKCGCSLQLFGFDDYFQSVRKYAQILISEGHNFLYDGKDRSLLFK